MASRASGISSSRLSVASATSYSEDNAKALQEVEGIDVFPPTSQAARRRAVLRGSAALAVHDDMLSHAQRRELLRLSQDCHKEKGFDDIFNRFLDVVGAPSEGGEEDDADEERHAGPQQQVVEEPIADDKTDKREGIVAKRVPLSRILAFPALSAPLLGILFALCCALFRKRLRQKVGSNTNKVLLPLVALWRVASSCGEDAKDWFWEGLCEGARSRFFENVFCVLVGHALARLPNRLANMLGWIID